MELSKPCALFCTVGRGLEKFAEEQIRLAGGRDLTVLDGKILFVVDSCSKSNISRLLALKGIERLFCLVKFQRNPGWSLSALLKIIDEFLLSSDPWVAAHEAWLHFQPAGSQLCNGNSISDVESASKRPKLAEDLPFVNLSQESLPQVYFRVNCKCSGKLRKRLDVQLLSMRLGRKLSALCHWTVNLKSGIDICVHINDAYAIAGLPVSCRPISDRAYHLNPGLRATICDLMVALADLQPYDIVCDPMCGSSSLLVEAGVTRKDVFMLGLDNCCTQLGKSAANLQHMTQQGFGVCYDLLLANVKLLCFRDACIDCVICDIPFGQKFGLDENLEKTLFPALIATLRRILTRSGRLVLLCSRKSVDNIRKLALSEHDSSFIGNTSKCLLTLKDRVDVSLGDTEASVLKFIVIG